MPLTVLDKLIIEVCPTEGWCYRRQSHWVSVKQCGCSLTANLWRWKYMWEKWKSKCTIKCSICVGVLQTWHCFFIFASALILSVPFRRQDGHSAASAENCCQVVWADCGVCSNKASCGVSEHGRLIWLAAYLTWGKGGGIHFCLTATAQIQSSTAGRGLHFHTLSSATYRNIFTGKKHHKVWIVSCKDKVFYPWQ